MFCESKVTDERTVSSFRAVLQPPPPPLGDESYGKIYTDSSMFEFTSEFMSGCVEDSDTQHHYKTLEK